MKRLRIILALVPLLAAGCCKENDECLPKVNTAIHFNLTDAAGNDVFSALAGNVELFAYDASGRQVGRWTVSKNELDVFAGKLLKLDPGTYTLIAWANATPAYTGFITGTSGSYSDKTANYLINAISSGGTVTDGDPLYYAPKNSTRALTVTVPTEGTVDVTAEMRNAHVKLEVTIDGYDRTTRAGTDQLKIEVTDLTSRYSFGMEAHGNRVSYVKYADGTATAGATQYAMFNIPVFDRTTNTLIRITISRGNQIIPPINIKELLNNKIDPETLWHLPIRIKFTEENGLIQTAVTVDLPEWGGSNVTPEI